MAILSKDEAQAILKKVLGFSTADECAAQLTGSTTGNIRYARNAVSTAGSSSNVSLGVEARFGKRSGVATCNQFDDATLRRCVQRAEEIARLAPEDPEYVPMLGPQQFLTPITYAASTAAISPDFRAQVAADSIALCEGRKLTAAGYLEDGPSFTAIRNSKGLEGYQQLTNLDFSVTVRTADGTGSGYAVGDFTDVTKFDTKAMTKRAADKAAGSVGAKAIEPGKYTVILEPAALVSDEGILNRLIYALDARSADEGRSFLSKKGGGNKLGEKMFDSRVTIYSDPLNTSAPGRVFDGDGLPVKPMTWIDKGVMKNMYYSRFWAEKNKKPATAFPSGFVMEGGTQSVEDLIKGTAKGILITRLWYIRDVDPQTLLVTGLTRDGTFYIENGKIKHPIKNMRFNESPVIMLNNIEAIGKPQRLGGNMVPPLKVRDFTFTSLSDAV
ncbi:TldD/PmbA family protein [Hymenobacter psychrotolerans]|uniref:Predicted Zn-dependent protease or its inactivated homolog n=1 Tax=Hymenobacter psychrotolerans DSM 18569 TaxID=1121959 RepID=A0A1M6PJ97_9BACT|nr:TldD/PmbA family protein [Hymenobacter psychrotolerans]SHK07964.1 Predicted Zn-dependent protease or its inactivated homolog [Hymenobacter psychrotolerans DSM 18569]